MSGAYDIVAEKVIAIFHELVGERANRLDGAKPSSDAREAFENALATDYTRNAARDIAFHLVDWNWDAAFLVAVHLFPDRFTAEELRAGADMVLVHAPNHLAAAALLAGHPVEDVFEIGVATNARQRI